MRIVLTGLLRAWWRVAVIFLVFVVAAALTIDGVVMVTTSRWWMFVITLLNALLHLRVYVAHGVTRHAFLGGSGLFTLTASAVLTLAAPQSWGARMPVIFLTLLAYAVSGAIIGASYYRLHPLPGTLMIVPAAVPPALITWVLGAEEFGRLSEPAVPAPAGFAIAVVVLAAGGFLLLRMLGSVPIRRPSLV